jgi:hypothetical protein
MFTQSFRRAASATLVALLLTATFVWAQTIEPNLKITRPQTAERQSTRVTPTAEIDRADVFRRVAPINSASKQSKNHRRRAATGNRASAFGHSKSAASAPTPQGFGTGSGDMFEVEPNDRIAQGVSLPVNVFGEISFDGDVDYYAFQALAGQQITIEPFAARLSNSALVADIALFDSSGRLIASDFGDEDDDPLIRYFPTRDEILVVGIADIDDLGGSASDYVLNIVRGFDVDENEPNDNRAQALPALAATVFGDIAARNDVDFYSFVAIAGQTLIVDIDAEVLGSRLDPEVNLLDPESGVEFFYNDQYDGDDSRFNIVLPYTGRYVIGVGAFDASSSGFYRLNASLVSAAGAPVLSQVTRLAKKLVEVNGAGFSSGARIEVNGIPRKTTFASSGTLRAKAKIRAGDVVTVANPPDDRRSNPLIAQ